MRCPDYIGTKSYFREVRSLCVCVREPETEAEAGIGGQARTARPELERKREPDFRKVCLRLASSPRPPSVSLGTRGKIESRCPVWSQIAGLWHS